MTKLELEKRNQELIVELTELQQKHDELKQSMQSGVLITINENNHYMELQRTTNLLMDRTEKLHDSNAELIKSIANLNGGVLKDLSETIVNLTRKT